MKIKGNIGKLDLFLLQEAFSEGHCIEAKVGASHLVGTETVKIHSEGWGDWYLFGGHCMWWGMVQADSFESAYEIYLEEFVVPDDMPETEEELEHGTWDSSGNWYSECTTSYIMELGIDNYDQWEIDLASKGKVNEK